MTAYWEKLKHPKWQKRRLELLERHGFACDRCESEEKTLHVHHGEYVKGREPWEYPDASMHVLCEDCHAEVEETMALTRNILGQLDAPDLDRVCGYAMGMLVNSSGNLVVNVKTLTGEMLMGLAHHFGRNYPDILEQAKALGRWKLDANDLWGVTDDSH